MQQREQRDSETFRWKELIPVMEWMCSCALMKKMTYRHLVCITLWIATLIWEVKKQRVKIKCREQCNEMRVLCVKCL